MIVRMQQGRSFRGAQLYYLHDVKGEHELFRLSDNRLAWVETFNCATNNPDHAFAEMIAVADHQNELRIAAGHRPDDKCEEPVLTVSLSWHPSEKPAKQHMIETAHDYIRAIGLEEHQAVILAHNDTEHQHVHIIANRVNPENGLVHRDSFSKNRAMRWREGYERQYGIIRDTDRAAEKHHHRHAHLARDGRAIEQHYARLEQSHARTVPALERDLLGRRHQHEREAFLGIQKGQYAERNPHKHLFRAARDQAYREIREAFAPRWRGLYREEQQLKKELKGLQKDTGAQAVRFARDGNFEAAWQSLRDPPQAIKARTERLSEIGQLRSALRTEQREASKAHQDKACKDLFQLRQLEFEAIKARQKGERVELRSLQARRDTGAPHDAERLAELTGLAPPTHISEQQKPAAEHQLDTPVILPARDSEPDRARHDQPDRQPVRDAADGLAGGIAKAAEVLGKVMEALLVPETAQEKAGREALARAEAAAAPEREAEAQAQEMAKRQAAHEAQQKLQEQIQAYFDKHGDNIRAYWQEREEKKRDERER